MREIILSSLVHTANHSRGVDAHLNESKNIQANFSDARSSPTYRRVGRDELRHLTRQLVGRRAVAPSGREGDSAHRERKGLAGEVSEYAVERVLDIRQCLL